MTRQWWCYCYIRSRLEHLKFSTQLYHWLWKLGLQGSHFEFLQEARTVVDRAASQYYLDSTLVG